MLNELLNHTEVDYSQAQRTVDLLRGVNHHELRLRIQGTLDIAGGTTSGDLLDDPIARLIDEFRLVRDGVEIIQPVTGRDLLALSRRNSIQFIAPTEPTTANAQTIQFRADIVIPFSPKFVLNPVEVALLAANVRNTFRAFIRWNTGRTTAASDPGSAAFVSGGDRAVTFTVQPTISFVEVYSVGDIRSWYEPRIWAEVTDQFVAATPSLPHDVISEFPIIMSVFTTHEGAAAERADLFNRIAFRSGTTQIIPNVPFDDLKTMERNVFPGVGVGVNGEIGWLFAAGGKLNNILNPNVLQQPRLTFDVEAPTNDPGVVRILNFGVTSIPGVTQR